MKASATIVVASGIRAMSDPDNEEIPTRVKNSELAKMVREKKAAKKALTKRLQELDKKLDEKDKEDGSQDEGGSEEEEDGSEQHIPINQRPFIDALKSMGRRTMEEKIDFSIFNGKMNAYLALD